jgi:aspartyl-tRNA(Asn)/glutamyl-tRNA(Gln) amidotransferase subunit A
MRFQESAMTAISHPPFTVRDPGRVRGLGQAIRDRKLSPVELTQRYLDRIAEADPHVQCWRQLDAERALAVAEERRREVEAGHIRGVLHGIPVAVKDIIDVEGLPSRANSRSRADIKPAAADAEVVLALKAQGAVILGKVHTTEFAFFDPSPARNPYNLAHTPGGSSSGSAAAVAAGMAPVAIGTQTVASVNRPAAYCGIAAYKPSSRSLSTFGITPLAPSYDTAGFYGWSVDDAVLAFEAAAPASMRLGMGQEAGEKLTVAIPEDEHTADMSTEMRAAHARVGEEFATAGHKVERVRSPISFARLHALQRSTMLYETGRALRYLLDAPAGSVGEKLTTAIREGLEIAGSRYLDERAEIDAMRTAFFTTLKADVFLWPAAPTTAPEGLAWTGEPKYIAPWTALGGPVVTMRAGLASNGLPLGVIVASPPGSDAEMCGWARRLAEAIGS